MWKKIGLVLIATVLLLGCTQENKKSQNLDELVDKIVEGNALAKEYVVGQGYSKQIRELGIEEVLELKQQKMFQELSEKELLEVKFAHPEKGTFVAIIDLQDENVVKFYRTASITMR